MSDIPKYEEAFNFIQNDSINRGRLIFISNNIVNLDLFWFKSYLKEDADLKHMDSLTKYTWFEDFYSQKLAELFQKQKNYSRRILFFSMIEKNTLRADLFIDRGSDSVFTHKEAIRNSRDKVYVYLFIFLLS